MPPAKRSCFLFFLALAALISSSADAVLSVQWENLRENRTGWIGSVDIVRVDHNDEEGGESIIKEYGICHIPTILGFNMGKLLPAVQSAIVVRLAIEHLNNGDGSIISEIDGLNDRCNIRFTTEMADSKTKAKAAIGKFLDIATGASDRTCPEIGPALPQLRLHRGYFKGPCAIITGSAATPLAVMSGVFNVPQLSGIAIDENLNDKDIYSTFARTVPDALAIANVMIEFFVALGTQNLAVLHHSDSSKASSLASAVTKSAGTKMAIMPFSFSFDDNTRFEGADEGDIKATLMALKESGYRHIAYLGENSHLMRILEAAVDVGVVGRDYLWAGTNVKFDDVEEGSKLHTAVPGFASITFEAGVPGKSNRRDNLLAAFQSLANPKDLAYINEMMPYPPLVDGDPVLPPPSFKKILLDYPYFVYDAVVALGLAACSVTVEGKYFNGTSLYKQLLETTFEGTTGDIKFVKETGTRDPETVYFSVVNWLAMEPANGTVAFRSTRTHLFRNSIWEKLEPFVYSDGSTIPPSDSSEPEVDYNYIGTGLRAVGLSLCAITLALSAFCAMWTKYYEKSSVVRASQPIFLLIICAGTFIMGSAIIPLSIDDEIATERGCDIACMSTPWLCCIGFALVFAALFSKMWRVNKIFKHASMRRIKVTALDVSKPLITLLVINVFVLALWTGLSPLGWVRETVAEDEFGNPTESVGQCKSDGALPYAITLVVVDLGAMVFALYEAYRARNISIEFAETSYILNSILCILLVCFVGIPVIIIASGDPKARFFVVACIIFVICTSLLLQMFIPKEKFRRKKRSIRSGLRSSIGSDQECRSSIGSDHEGLHILNNPQTIADLEEEVATLKRTCSNLEKDIKKLLEGKDKTSVATTDE